VLPQLLPSHLFCDVEVWVRCHLVECHPPYLYASSRPRVVSLRNDKGQLHQHACPADLPHNLDTPHSNEPPRPFVCIVAPMVWLQHLANYTHCRMSHTYSSVPTRVSRMPSASDSPIVHVLRGVHHAQHGVPAMSASITITHKRMPCQVFAYNRTLAWVVYNRMRVPILRVQSFDSLRHSRLEYLTTQAPHMWWRFLAWWDMETLDFTHLGSCRHGKVGKPCFPCTWIPLIAMRHGNPKF